MVAAALTVTVSYIVVIGASAGGLEPVRQIVSALPVPCRAAIFIVIHTGPNKSLLPSLLSKVGGLPAQFAEHNVPIEAGHIYVPPPDYHVFLGLTHIRLNQGPKVHHTRPAIDPLFISAAKAHRERVLGVVLSGGDGDGAEGLRAIKQCGGAAIVQSPDTAAEPSMPLAAMMTDHYDASLSVGEIARRLRVFCSR